MRVPTAAEIQTINIVTTRPANSASLEKTEQNYLAMSSANNLCARAAFSTASASETLAAGAALKPAKSQRNINSFVKPRARSHQKTLPAIAMQFATHDHFALLL